MTGFDAPRPRDGLLLVGDRLVGGQRIAGDGRVRGMQHARPLQPCDRLPGLADSDGAGSPRESRGQQVGAREHRLALREMRRRPRRRQIGTALNPRLGVSTGPGGARIAGFPFQGLRDEPRRVEPEFGGLLAPVFAQRVLVDIALVRAGHQRRAFGKARAGGRIAEATRFHRRFDLGAPRRERLDHLPRYPGDLEAPVGVGLLDAAAEFRQLPRQFAAVHGADQHLGGAEPLVGHRAPPAVLAPDHVGEHGMRMELRIEVAGSVVAEGGGDRLLAAGADHASGLRVLHPSLDGVALDPGEGASHRPVVGGDDPAVAADQGGGEDHAGEPPPGAQAAGGSADAAPGIAPGAGLGPRRACVPSVMNMNIARTKDPNNGL